MKEVGRNCSLKEFEVMISLLLETMNLRTGGVPKSKVYRKLTEPRSLAN